MDKKKADKLAAVCQRELALSENGGTGDDENRQQAIAYYLAQLPGPDPVEGKTSVVSTDVADMILAIMAIMAPMLSTDCVASFEPDANDDDQQATAESAIVNQIILEDNAGFIEIQEACKDALLMRNAVMKVTVDDGERVRSFSLEGTPDADREALAANAMNGAGVTKAAIVGDQLVVTGRARKIRVNAVPVENMRWSAGWSGALQDIRFIAEAVDYTRSDLVDMGIDRRTVDKLSAVSRGGDQAVTLARSRGVAVSQGETRDQDIISCHECYQLLDLDGDGISERYKVLLANETITLDYERADLIPYAIGYALVNAHRVEGESLFDHLKASQDVKTALLRQLINNTAAINNGRYIYDPSRANEDDILNPSAGGGIRARDPTAVVPLMIPDVTGGILAALQYEDKRRTERGGAALDMQGANNQLVGETAFGTERQFASREMLVSLMAANLSETLIRGIYTLTHEFLRRFADRPYGARIAGAWVMTDPRQWKPRTRLNVKTGRTPGARVALQQVMQQNTMLQAQAMQAGMAGVLVSPVEMHRGLIEWLSMAGITNPERFWIDPASEGAQQAVQQQQQQGQAAQQQQQQMIELQVQLEQQRIEIERLKVQAQAQNDQAQIEFSYYEADLKAAGAETELAATGALDLEKERMRHAATLAGARIGSAGGAVRTAGGNDR